MRNFFKYTYVVVVIGLAVLVRNPTILVGLMFTSEFDR